MPLNAYTASFTVNSVVYGFDVRVNSYGETTEANLTIRTIPWASSYNIVVQGAVDQSVNPGATVGSKPVTRNYRAVVYSETDYLNLRGQRGQIGLLATAREPGPHPGYKAVLTDCKRADQQDPTDPTGPQTIELSFTMLE